MKNRPLLTENEFFDDPDIGYSTRLNGLDNLSSKYIVDLDTKAVVYLSLSRDHALNTVVSLTHLINNYYIDSIKGNIDESLERGLDKVIGYVSKTMSILIEEKDIGPVDYYDIISKHMLEGAIDRLDVSKYDIMNVCLVDIEAKNDKIALSTVPDKAYALSLIRKEDSNLVFLKAIVDSMSEFSDEIKPKTNRDNLITDLGVHDHVLSMLKTSIKLLMYTVNSSSYNQGVLHGYDDMEIDRRLMLD